VLHLPTLIEELDLLKKSIPDVYDRLYICKRAHVVFDLHREADAFIESENSAGGSVIGTTKRGIGPCYASKCLRAGIRVADLMHIDDDETKWEDFRVKYFRLHAQMTKRFSNFQLDGEAEVQNIRRISKILESRIVDGVEFLTSRRKRGSKVLLEGANATMLDNNFGTYPFVTSSCTTAGGIGVGLGIPPKAVGHVVGVVKAYTTRVGNGPFPTEEQGEVGHHLSSKGNEFGTTTGRPRRCGWLDIPMLRYSADINGFDSVIITKLDVMSGLSKIQICVGHKSKSTGVLVPMGGYMVTVDEFEDAVPVYESVDGWNDDLSKCQHFEDLPEAAKAYVRRIESLIEVRIAWVGTGADRSQCLSMCGNPESLWGEDL